MLLHLGPRGRVVLTLGQLGVGEHTVHGEVGDELGCRPPARVDTRVLIGAVVHEHQNNRLIVCEQRHRVKTPPCFCLCAFHEGMRNMNPPCERRSVHVRLKEPGCCDSVKPSPLTWDFIQGCADASSTS